MISSKNGSKERIQLPEVWCDIFVSISVSVSTATVDIAELASGYAATMDSIPCSSRAVEELLGVLTIRAVVNLGAAGLP